MSNGVHSLQALLNDNHSGSSELLKKTVEWVQSCLRNGQKGKQILSNLEILRTAHPSMALLQSFHSFFQKIPLNQSRVTAWLQMYNKHETAACRKFSEHLSHFKNILVHSNSGQLLGALNSVRGPLNIFCAEGRPAYEGVKLAEALSLTHHKIFLTTDIAAFSVIPRVEILAFGCDSITPRGIVNKIGTAPLAKAAYDQRKMNYFVATSEKFVESWNDEFLLRQGHPEELYKGKNSIHVENYYFDLTPAEYVRGIFLENGISHVSTL